MKSISSVLLLLSFLLKGVCAYEDIPGEDPLLQLCLNGVSSVHYIQEPFNEQEACEKEEIPGLPNSNMQQNYTFLNELEVSQEFLLTKFSMDPNQEDKVNLPEYSSKKEFSSWERPFAEEQVAKVIIQAYESNLKIEKSTLSKKLGIDDKTLLKYIGQGNKQGRFKPEHLTYLRESEIYGHKRRIGPIKKNFVRKFTQKGLNIEEDEIMQIRTQLSSLYKMDTPLFEENNTISKKHKIKTSKNKAKKTIPQLITDEIKEACQEKRKIYRDDLIIKYGVEEHALPVYLWKANKKGLISEEVLDYMIKQGIYNPRKGTSLESKSGCLNEPLGQPQKKARTIMSSHEEMSLSPQNLINEEQEGNPITPGLLLTPLTPASRLPQILLNGENFFNFPLTPNNP